MLTSVAVFTLGVSVVTAGTIVASQADRDSYVSKAIAWFPEDEAKIASRDLFNGPNNPYDLKTFQELDCEFVEPTAEDPMGGTTPKFNCEFEFEKEKIQVKIKYDQQYNDAYNWKQARANHEV